MTTEPAADESAVPAEVVADLKSKYGEVHLLGNEFGVAVFRVPKLTEWQRYRDERANPQASGVALRHLVNMCRVWPEAVEFKALIDGRPAMIDVFGGELLEIAGAKSATIVKKL